jgi:hypothetical protein
MLLVDPDRILPEFQMSGTSFLANPMVEETMTWYDC